VMPGGMKINLHDMDKLNGGIEKLKNLLPKQTPK